MFARSSTDDHFEAYKRAKLDGIDVCGGEAPVRRLAASTAPRAIGWAAPPANDRFLELGDEWWPVRAATSQLVI